MIWFIKLTHAEPPAPLFLSSCKEGTAISNQTPAEPLLQRNKQQKKKEDLSGVADVPGR